MIQKYLIQVNFINGTSETLVVYETNREKVIDFIYNRFKDFKSYSIKEISE